MQSHLGLLIVWFLAGTAAQDVEVNAPTSSQGTVVKTSAISPNAALLVLDHACEHVINGGACENYTEELGVEIQGHVDNDTRLSHTNSTQLVRMSTKHARVRPQRS